MKRSSRDFFEALSQYCYVSKTPLLFQKNAAAKSRYDRGRLQVYEWVDALCFYYLQKEKSLKKEFSELLEKRCKEIEKMPASSYRDGLLEALTSIRERVRATQ